MVDRRQAEQGAAVALRLVEQLAGAHGPVKLLLDLRGRQFADLQAHKAWSEGFARNPALQRLVRAVAIVADDTPAFRAEQELLTTERVRFFVDGRRAEQWLAAATRAACSESAAKADALQGRGDHDG
jgi:hypothetical protein